MDDKALTEKAREIDAIYQKYLARLMALKKKQDAVVMEFTAAMEGRRIKKLRKELGLE